MLYRVSKRLRLTGWCFMCNPTTAAVYVRHGVSLTQLGPVVDPVGNRKRPRRRTAPRRRSRRDGIGVSGKTEGGIGRDRRADHTSAKAPA
jgi:hypothetical protein